MFSHTRENSEMSNITSKYFSFFNQGSGFSKNVSSRERKTGFFVTFNVIICHIVPENLIENPQVVQEI